MTLLTPESTAFSWLSYDESKHQLTVGFRNQTSYQYCGVPSEVFTLLLSSSSRGMYFNIEIRNRYPGKRVNRRPTTGKR
jgi:KTSC domain